MNKKAAIEEIRMLTRGDKVRPDAAHLWRKTPKELAETLARQRALHKVTDEECRRHCQMDAAWAAEAAKQ